MPRVAIALGSNLGDRSANLRTACDSLRKIATLGEVFLQSPIYRTEPLLCPPGAPFFHNSVVEIACDRDPFELLALTRAVEIKLGREVRGERNAPRIIDLDLLYFGDEIIDTEELTLPHSRLSERRFVLQPLADIRPDLVLPGKSASIAMLLEQLISEEPPLIRVPS